MNDKDREAIRKLRKLGKRLRDGLGHQYVGPRGVVNLPEVYKAVVREQYEKDVAAGRIIPPPDKPKENISPKPKPAKAVPTKKPKAV